MILNKFTPLVLTAFVLTACGGDSNNTTTTPPDDSKPLVDPIIPVDPGPVDPGPVDPGPVDPGPVNPGPVDPGPVDPGPVDPGPVDPGPVDPIIPVEPGPDPVVIPLQLNEPTSGFVTQDNTVVFTASGVRSVILVSDNDADMFIKTDNGNTECSSQSGLRLDKCENLNAGSNYTIEVFGFRDTDFTIVANSHDNISGPTTITDIGPNTTRFYTATAITGLHLTGDATMTVYNDNVDPICIVGSGLYNSCNNVDGSVNGNIERFLTYVVEIETHVVPDMRLETSAADTLNPLTSPEHNSFIDTNGFETYFVSDTSIINLISNTGDLDLIVSNPTTNEVICESRSTETVDSCSVPFGSYRIDIFSYLSGQYRLFVE